MPRSHVCRLSTQKSESRFDSIRFNFGVECVRIHWSDNKEAKMHVTRTRLSILACVPDARGDRVIDQEAKINL